MTDKHADPPKGAIDFIERVNDVLYDDVMKHFDILDKEDIPCWRRGSVRASFALIEGLIFTMKFESLWRHKYLQTPDAHAHNKLSFPKDSTLKDIFGELSNRMLTMVAGAGFSQQEILLLVEFTSDLNEHGEIVTRRGAKITLTKNIQFAFRSLSKAYGITFKLDKGGQGWQQFLRAVKVRDRLTHPKVLEQLTVSDDDMNDVHNAALWVYDQKGQLRKIIVERLIETGELNATP